MGACKPLLIPVLMMTEAGAHWPRRRVWLPRAPALGMVIQYQAGHVYRALCLEPVGSESIPGTPSGRSSIVQTSPAKYNPFPRSALSLNTKFVNDFFHSQK